MARLADAKNPHARAYAAAVMARWHGRFPPDFDAIEKLAVLAIDRAPRVRLAAIVAAAQIGTDDAIVVVLSASQQPRDTFIDTALNNAAQTLRRRWEPLLPHAERLGWKSEWVDFLVKTQNAPDPRVAKTERAADAQTRELMKSAVKSAQEPPRQQLHM